MSNTAVRSNNLSVSARLLSALTAIVAAVALPQLVHLIGAEAGLGTTLGEILLPMQLPIILAGLLAGPMAGALAGAAAPLVSFLLTSMPGAANLPYMMVELAVYGLVAGLLMSSEMMTLLKVLAAQLAGRLARLAAVAVAVHLIGAEGSVMSVIGAARLGAAGIILQLCLIPITVRLIDRISKR